MTDFIEVQIPFSGFYNSHHDGVLDDALEQIFSDDHGDVNAPLHERAYANIDWKAVHQAYAEDYAETFIDSFLVHSGAVVLDSPKFYNFSTDRIFINVPVDVVQAWIDGVDEDAMDKISAKMFTSYDGFSSHYSPDWRGWGIEEAHDLDHNEAYAFLMAKIESNDGGQDHLDYWETDVAYESNGNGALDNILFDAGNEVFNRVADIQHYLRLREERNWRQRMAT